MQECAGDDPLFPKASVRAFQSAASSKMMGRASQQPPSVGAHLSRKQMRSPLSDTYFQPGRNVPLPSYSPVIRQAMDNATVPAVQCVNMQSSPFPTYA